MPVMKPVISIITGKVITIFNWKCLAIIWLGLRQLDTGLCYLTYADYYWIIKKSKKVSLINFNYRVCLIAVLLSHNQIFIFKLPWISRVILLQYC